MNLKTIQRAANQLIGTHQRLSVSYNFFLSFIISRRIATKGIHGGGLISKVSRCIKENPNIQIKMLSKLRSFSQQYPVVRGMVSYACIWPLGSCIQQKIAGQDQIDYKRCFRFALYGSCYVAPTLYMWVRISSRFWPNSNFKTAVKKAVIEQFTYGPAALASFFAGMTLLEGGTIQNAIHEVRIKFFDTYKVGICVWPVLQTINFAFVPESNRVIFVSICSLIWTSFLAYMKELEMKKKVLKNQIEVIKDR